MAESDYPFQIGKHYRVLKSFAALRDRFVENETLRYTGSAYSRYDGYTGHFFADATGGGRTWDVADDESVEIWRGLFAEIT
ncbi:hypothetical protein [Oleiharenicola lentus]|uniref:hypothetical protein n=1 Tax=Oleiharenicola lentus TaxID=2508720 RepID=UPI003F667FAA